MNTHLIVTFITFLKLCEGFYEENFNNKSFLGSSQNSAKLIKTTIDKNDKCAFW